MGRAAAATSWTRAPRPLLLGINHLGFNDQEGRFYRLWQHRKPEPLHTGEAILLRPSDIDQVTKVAMGCALKHPANPRSSTIIDEIATGSKAIVMHYAQQSGAT